MRKVASVEEDFDTIHERFKPDQAKGVNATFVYLLDGGGTWTLRVKDGELTVEPGAIEKPTVTFSITASDYIKLVNGDLNGTMAFMTRKLKVSGSIPMAQQMNKFLPPRS